MWRMRQNVSEGIEDIENLKTSIPSIPLFCVLRIYLLIFREKDFFYEFPRTFKNVREYVRGKDVECLLTFATY